MIPYERPAWHADAACNGVDPDLFFPARGVDVTSAVRVCNECPVRAECLAYALAAGEKHGVWGGLSERQRRRIRNNLRAVA